MGLEQLVSDPWRFSRYSRLAHQEAHQEADPSEDSYDKKPFCYNARLDPRKALRSKTHVRLELSWDSVAVNCRFAHPPAYRQRPRQQTVHQARPTLKQNFLRIARLLVRLMSLLEAASKADKVHEPSFAF